MGSGSDGSTACPWICSVMEATMSDLFSGFERRQIETSGATINLVIRAADRRCCCSTAISRPM